MPNFLLIGAGKSGTSSLYNYLKQHPEIYMSEVKEPGFFAFEGEQLNFSHPRDREYSKKLITELTQYISLFDKVDREKAIGEASPSYIYYPKASESIKHYIPNTKIIAILRHPVDRAYSSYLFRCQFGHEKVSFVEAFREDLEGKRDNWLTGHFVGGGLYHQMLKQYFDKFDRRQIKVCLYEDLKNNSANLMQNIYEFLEVNYKFIPDTSIKNNMTLGIPKNKLLNLFLNPQQFKTIKQLIKPIFPHSWGKKIIKSNFSKPQLSIDTRRELTEVFREDILKLQDLIQRDLSFWLSN